MFNVEEKKSSNVYLHLVKGKKHYGIPLENIVNVYNLTDKEFAQEVEERYRSILHLKESTAKLLVRQPYKSPLNLIERTGVKSAVVVRKNNIDSLLLIDELMNIEVIDRNDLENMEKSGKDAEAIPDIVIIKHDQGK
jgi:hypothetical protein